MRNQKIIFAIVVLSAMFFAFPPENAVAENEAARCAIPPFNQAFNYSKAVFVGRVLSETKKGDVKTFEFEVEKYWKGAVGEKVEISIYETVRFQAWFRVGEKYLIFATGGDAGKLNVGRCSRSKDIEDAAEDLEKLGAAKNPA